MLRFLSACALLTLLTFQANAQTTKKKFTAKPTPPPEVSIREQASTEIQTLPASTAKHTSTTGALSREQTATMLILEDPFEAPRLRTFQWGFGIHLTNYKPQGTVEVSGIGNQNLGASNSTYMPSISLGTLYGLNDSSMGAFEIGVELEGGFATQESSVRSGNGTILKGRMNTSLLDARAQVRWGQGFKSPVHVRAGYGVARYTVTQTSDSSLARWTRDGNLTSMLLGLDYKLSRKWVAQVNYRTYGTRGGFPQGLDAPAAGFDLGAQVIW